MASVTYYSQTKRRRGTCVWEMFDLEQYIRHSGTHFSFSIPEFELFGGWAMSTNLYLLIAY